MPTANLAPCGLSDNTTACEVRRGPSPVTEAHAHAFISSEAEDMTDEELEDPAVLATHRALNPLPEPVGGWFVADTRAVTAAIKQTDLDYWERAREYHHAVRAELRAEQKRDNRANRAKIYVSLNVPTVEGAGGGGRRGEGWGRKDKGSRRAGRRAHSPPAPTLPLSLLSLRPSTVGTFIPAEIPRGLRTALPVYGVAAFDAAAIDICHELNATRGREYTCLTAETMRVKYGRPMINGVRVWTWDKVREDLIDSGIIEVERNVRGRQTYRTKEGSATGGRAKGYRLTATWRGLPNEIVQRGAELYVPPTERGTPVDEHGAAVRVHPWLRQCAEEVEYDLEGALRAVLALAGAVWPEVVTSESLAAAIEAATPSADRLADVEAWRKPLGVRHYTAEGRCTNPHVDPRSTLEIVKDKARGQISGLMRWRVHPDGFWCFRDTAGLRLHTPITNLGDHLRPFLRLDGEECVTIDATNSQMVFVAESVRLANPTSANAIGFERIVGEGRYYEETFIAVHGREPTEAERARWKPRVMQKWLFAHAYDQHLSVEGQALARRFPTAHLWMLSQKVADNRALPCSCQRREASVWLDMIAPRLADKGIKCLTIHDSVMVPKSRADEALAIVESVYQEAGLRAKFKVT